MFLRIEGFQVEINFEGLILEAVHVDDVLGDIKVHLLALVILNDEEQVESRHNWWRNVHIISQ